MASSIPNQPLTSPSQPQFLRSSSQPQPLGSPSQRSINGNSVQNSTNNKKIKCVYGNSCAWEVSDLDSYIRHYYSELIHMVPDADKKFIKWLGPENFKQLTSLSRLNEYNEIYFTCPYCNNDYEIIIFLIHLRKTHDFFISKLIQIKIPQSIITNNSDKKNHMFKNNNRILNSPLNIQFNAGKIGNQSKERLDDTNGVYIKCDYCKNLETADAMLAEGITKKSVDNNNNNNVVLYTEQRLKKLNKELEQAEAKLAAETKKTEQLRKKNLDIDANFGKLVENIKSKIRAEIDSEMNNYRDQAKSLLNSIEPLDLQDALQLKQIEEEKNRILRERAELDKLMKIMEAETKRITKLNNEIKDLQAKAAAEEHQKLFRQLQELEEKERERAQKQLEIDQQLSLQRNEQLTLDQTNALLQAAEAVIKMQKALEIQQIKSILDQEAKRALNEKRMLNRNNDRRAIANRQQKNLELQNIRFQQEEIERLKRETQNKIVDMRKTVDSLRKKAKDLKPKINMFSGLSSIFSIASSAFAAVALSVASTISGAASAAVNFIPRLISPTNSGTRPNNLLKNGKCVCRRC